MAVDLLKVVTDLQTVLVEKPEDLKAITNEVMMATRVFSYALYDFADATYEVLVKTDPNPPAEAKDGDSRFVKAGKFIWGLGHRQRCASRVRSRIYRGADAIRSASSEMMGAWASFVRDYLEDDAVVRSSSPSGMKIRRPKK